MSSRPRQSPLLRLLNPLLAPLYSRLRYRTPPFPHSLIIETTSRCNLNCRMCPRTQMRRPARDMDPGLFVRLIDQAAPWDAAGHLRFIALHWFGEPLLHPRLLEFIEYAGSRLPNLLQQGHRHEAMRGLTLSTNATLLSDELSRGLIGSKLTWLGVSVDGASPETYESLRCGGVFDKVVPRVERLLELNRESARPLPVIAVQIIATPETRREFEQAAARWTALASGRGNVRIELKPYTDWAGQVEAAELCAPDQRPGFVYLDCGRLHDTLVIGAGGEIGLCCYDVQADLNLGNANEQTLAEIWRAKPLQDLRRQQRRGCHGALALCRNCRMGRKYPLDILTRRTHAT